MSETGKSTDVEPVSQATPKEAKTKEVRGKGVEEAKKEKVAEEKEEDKVLEEKALTVNLRRAYLSYGRKAAPKAIKIVRKAASKAFKTEDVKLSSSVNEALWRRGKAKTDRKISLRIQKLESGVVRVLAAEG
ncbi:MAG: hypothetical protein QFX35_07090 [Candidatus Verstraetearchaeota archaeon]|nr:hypothetical protein [Candidatus Verstraetearchaeota archaeon]